MGNVVSAGAGQAPARQAAIYAGKQQPRAGWLPCRHRRRRRRYCFCMLLLLVVLFEYKMGIYFFARFLLENNDSPYTPPYVLNHAFSPQGSPSPSRAQPSIRWALLLSCSLHRRYHRRRCVIVQWCG